MIFPRLVLEITEHAAVKDYKALAVGLEPYRRRGAKLAVDDAGAAIPACGTSSISSRKSSSWI